VPTTGVPLPFLSYGGMSLVFTMCGMGMLLNISTQAVHTAAPGKGTSASARSARKKR
jgi:cell division protein FtsW